MQAQAPPTFAPAGAPAHPGDLPPGGLFNAFYEATAPIAFDFASGLAARPDDAAAIVAASYEDVWSAHEQSGAPYHVVPLLADVYAKSVAYPRPAAHATRPGVDAVATLGEPYRSVLHLSERHRFSPEDTGAILGIGPEEVRRDHDDARMVVHGVSAALALCPGGAATCPDLATTLDTSRPVVDQTERILDHAERCPYCSEVALASPDPIMGLRYGSMRNGNGEALSAGPAVPAAVNGQSSVGLVGAPVVGAAAAAVWSAAPAGAAPLPGPAPSLASKAAAADRAWAPMRLWNNATGWQKSGAIVAVLLIVALVIAIAAGGDSEDVAARTNPNGSGTTPQGSVSSSPPPIATIPSTTTTGPVTTTVEQVPSTVPPSTGPYTSNSSSGGSYSSSGSSAATPATTEPAATTTTTAPPPPVIQSGDWQQQWKGWDPKDMKSTYTVVFTFATTGTSTSYTTSMGPGGQVASGSGALTFEGVRSGSQILTLTSEGPGGSVTQRFSLVLL